MNTYKQPLTRTWPAGATPHKQQQEQRRWWPAGARPPTHKHTNKQEGNVRVDPIYLQGMGKPKQDPTDNSTSNTDNNNMHNKYDNNDNRDNNNQDYKKEANELRLMVMRLKKWMGLMVKKCWVDQPKEPECAEDLEDLPEEEKEEEEHSLYLQGTSEKHEVNQDSTQQPTKEDEEQLKRKETRRRKRTRKAAANKKEQDELGRMVLRLKNWEMNWRSTRRSKCSRQKREMEVMPTIPEKEEDKLEEFCFPKNSSRKAQEEEEEVGDGIVLDDVFIMANELGASRGWVRIDDLILYNSSNSCSSCSDTNNQGWSQPHTNEAFEIWCDLGIFTKICNWFTFTPQARKRLHDEGEEAYNTICKSMALNARVLAAS
jgi:hypothetical protein